MIKDERCRIRNTGRGIFPVGGEWRIGNREWDSINLQRMK